MCACLSVCACVCESVLEREFMAPEHHSPSHTHTLTRARTHTLTQAPRRHSPPHTHANTQTYTHTHIHTHTLTHTYTHRHPDAIRPDGSCSRKSIPLHDPGTLAYLPDALAQDFWHHMRRFLLRLGETSMPYVLRPTPYSLHPAPRPYALLPMSYDLHPTPYALRPSGTICVSFSLG